jgi:hypothetical protein
MTFDEIRTAGIHFPTPAVNPNYVTWISHCPVQKFVLEATALSSKKLKALLKS